MYYQECQKILQTQVNKLFDNFLWNGRRPKIPLAKLQNNKKEGGANLVNLSTKEDALKALWLCILKNDVDMSILAYYNLNNIMKDVIWRCNLQNSDAKYVNNKPENFWTHVLESWCVYNYESDVIDLEVPNQIIWYNSHVRIDKKPFFWKKAYKSGLKFVSQLFVNGRFIDAEEAEDKFQLNWLQYQAIKKALPKSFTEAMLNGYTHVTTMIYKYDSFVLSVNPTQLYYKRVTTDTELVYSTYIRWVVNINLTLSYEEYKKMFTNIYVITNNTKLRSFQFRLLHLSLITNVQLAKWHIISNESCYFCQQNAETVSHLLFECKIARNLREHIPVMLRNLKGNHEIPVFTKENVLMNNTTTKVVSLANFLILVMKQYLYACKCLKKTPTPKSSKTG